MTKRVSTMRRKLDREMARAQGCLLGQLAGDALGALVELQTAAQIRQNDPHGVRELAESLLG